MYGSNRVKRRPSPYEMEITDGEYGEKPKMWRGIIMGCRVGPPPARGRHGTDPCAVWLVPLGAACGVGWGQPV